MKRVSGLMVAVLLLLGACRDEPGPSASQASGGRTTAGVIVAMGDSLTAGYGVAIEESYPALLEKKLRAAGHPYQVINAGVSGETSSGALSRLEWVLTMKPDIVILETGANDVMVVKPCEGSVDEAQRLVPWVQGPVVLGVGNLAWASLALLMVAGCGVFARARAPEV